MLNLDLPINEDKNYNEIKIIQIEPTIKINLRSKKREFSTKIGKALSILPPTEANTSSGNANFSLLWLGPDEWLLYSNNKNLTLEELTEDTCKYMEGHPDDKSSSFCGRKNVEKFSYCPLHLMMVFQPKGKKEELTEKDDDVPKFIEKKIKSA